MFKEMSTSSVTTARLVRGQLGVTKKIPDPSSFHRLMEALAIALNEPGLDMGTTDLGKLFVWSTARVSHWRTRGVSFEGAFEAQRRWGINCRRWRVSSGEIGPIHSPRRDESVERRRPNGRRSRAPASSA